MKRHFIKWMAFSLALLLLVPIFAGCSSKGKTLLTMKKDGVKVTFSVNYYRFLLSRLKGNYIDNRYVNESGKTADQAAFWQVKDTYNGKTTQTLDEYLREQILEDCQIFVAALWMFEKSGLSLSAEAKASVEQEMTDLVNDYGNGSKTKLNAILSDYGMNYDLLKEFYLIQEKVKAVKTDLYGANGSLIGTGIKDAYMNENYIRFKQIYLPNYKYVLQTDEYGNVIYYDKDTKAILYDESGYLKTVNGQPVTDSYGNKVRYNKDYTAILYDTVNGLPMQATDESGNPLTESLPAEELATLYARAQTLSEELQNSSDDAFDRAIESEHAANETDASEFTDGYYLRRGMDYSTYGTDLAYLTDILSALDNAEDGTVFLYVSPYGYHVIRKYTPAPEAYRNEVNAVWFSTFASDLIEKLFLEECSKYFGDIERNDKVYSSVPNLTDISGTSIF